MLNGLSNSLSSAAITGGKSSGIGGSGAAPTTSFADSLKKSIDEVSKLQQDASQAVDDLAMGKTDNVSGVMTAMEKSDLAFKTLLSIRSKLMDAYDEIKGITV